jgi:hypothetical protein
MCPSADDRAPDDRAAEQATVHSVHEDDSVSLLGDDGMLLNASAAAVAAGGWRALRPGQRVSLRRQVGKITAVLPPATPGDALLMEPPVT